MEKPENKPLQLWAALGRAKKFLDKVLIFCAVSIWAFTITMIVIFCIQGATPDTLIDRFFSVFGIEGVLCAVITVVKLVIDKLLNKQLGLESTETDMEYDENESTGE